jgi:hypothetical protein
VDIIKYFAVRIAQDIAQPSSEYPLRPILWIPHTLVVEVPQVQYKFKLFLLLCPLILEDHAAQGVRSTQGDIVTTDERKPDRTGITIPGRGAGAPHSTRISL